MRLGRCDALSAIISRFLLVPPCGPPVHVEVPQLYALVNLYSLGLIRTCSVSLEDTLWKTRCDSVLPASEQELSFDHQVVIWIPCSPFCRRKALGQDG